MVDTVKCYLNPQLVWSHVNLSALCRVGWVLKFGSAWVQPLGLRPWILAPPHVGYRSEFNTSMSKGIDVRRGSQKPWVSPLQSINQFNSNLAAWEPDSKWYAVEIIDKNSKRNKQCAYMYIDAGRDVWSGLGGNSVGQSLRVNSTFSCVNWVLAMNWWVLA